VKAEAARPIAASSPPARHSAARRGKQGVRAAQTNMEFQGNFSEQNLKFDCHLGIMIFRQQL
jgi:hypothetical protein